MKSPVVLAILDGWGMSSAWAGNALHFQATPNFHRLWRSYPHASLIPFSEIHSDLAVQNTELGYSMIGAGRTLPDEGDQISQAIKTKQFFHHPGLAEVFQTSNEKVHIIGFLDPFGKHSRLDHIMSLVQLGKVLKTRHIYLHLFLGQGPDYRFRAYPLANQLIRALYPWGGAEIVSLIGSRYLLDSRPGQLKKVHDLLTKGKGWYFSESISSVFRKFYQSGNLDENFPPTCLREGKQIIGRIRPGDKVIIASLEPESSRPLIKILENPSLLGSVWDKKLSSPHKLYTFLDDGMASQAQPLFASHPVQGALGPTLSQNKIGQFKVAPFSKLYHLGFYFNGGRSAELPYEDRKFYQAREASEDILLGAGVGVEILLRELKKERYGFYIISLPNLDILGHLANIRKMPEAVLAFDNLLGYLAEQVSQRLGTLIITASHGNAEEVLDKKTGEPNFQHTRNPVPFILVGPSRQFKIKSTAAGSPGSAVGLAAEGDIPELVDTIPYLGEHTLADIAPTILGLFGLAKPPEMTGHSLVDKV